MKKEAIVLLGHGSRRSEANDILKGITEIIKTKLDGKNVEYAYLEHAEPNIRDIIEKLAMDNFEIIYVMPYFLYSGNHVSRDIPKILNDYKEKYPKINIKLGDHIGIDERMAQLVTERIASVKLA